MKKVKLSVAERISLVISLVGTALSALSFFHSPTVVAKVPPLTACHEDQRKQPQSLKSLSSQPCYPTQRNSEDPLIYAKLREISHRLDKLEATRVQSQSKSLSFHPLYSEPNSSTNAQTVLDLPQIKSKMVAPASSLEQPSVSSSRTRSTNHTDHPLEETPNSSDFQSDLQSKRDADQFGSINKDQQQIRSVLLQTQQALKLYAIKGDRASEITTLDKIADLFNQLGQYAEAEKTLQQKLTLTQGKN